MGSQIICFDGVSGLGKTKYLKELHKRNKKVAFNDFVDINATDYKIDLIITMLTQFAKCEQNNSGSTLYVDRSPLSVLYDYQIGEILKNSTTASLKYNCGYILNKYFIKKNEYHNGTIIQYYLMKILEKYQTILFVTDDVEKIAHELYTRADPKDRFFANKCGYKFNLHYCKWYTQVQNEYFRQLSANYYNDVTLCIINEYSDFRKVSYSAIKNAKAKNKTNYTLMKLTTFNKNDKKPRRK
ncbi:HZV_115-like protein [Carcinus maenas nudivirus]|uniref:HZV_115-like protein n=1 Tax=Carcinus maenas nudivirus TaxID=2880837 RepID=A0AAE8Y530_9VIRU|nr:HZV_115-like protein [Carcinus maenas nudivirus]UBZ25600.1 HZV_115-like protein [Carcinus maenas nudivirus]